MGLVMGSVMGPGMGSVNLLSVLTVWKLNLNWKLAPLTITIRVRHRAARALMQLMQDDLLPHLYIKWNYIQFICCRIRLSCRVIHGQMAPQDIRYILRSEPRHGETFLSFIFLGDWSFSRGQVSLRSTHHPTRVPPHFPPSPLLLSSSHRWSWSEETL